ncbi:MAG: NUDIX hydrolase [Longimicrobiales bacterium]
MRSVTALLFDDEGRLLLVRHSSAVLWVAPGGMIEPDEDPAAAARRENLKRSRTSQRRAGYRSFCEPCTNPYEAGTV